MSVHPTKSFYIIENHKVISYYIKRVLHRRDIDSSIPIFVQQPSYHLSISCPHILLCILQKISGKFRQLHSSVQLRIHVLLSLLFLFVTFQLQY